MQSGKQKTLFSFFNKTPQNKSAKETPSKTDSPSTPQRPKPEQPKHNDRFPPGSLVWSKLSGYPWWPSMVCNHPTEGKSARKGEIHVMFLDTPVNRSWVNATMVKKWGESVLKDGAGDKNWEKGVKDAEAVAGLSNEERLETLLVNLLPSDEEWSDEEISPGSKENKHKSVSQEPERKRRRIIMMDSDDSDCDEDFKPSKDDLKEVEDEFSDGSEAEMISDDEPMSPVKGSKKRKMEKKSEESKKSKVLKSSPESSLSTPVGKFVSGVASVRTPSLATPSTPLPSVCDSTKKKLAMFGASPSSSPAVERESPSQQYSHNQLPFLRPDKIRDREKHPRDHEDFNPRTLYVPDDFLNKQTPGQRQWWELKSQYFDVILFFKMGKFYELFHMDADVGVSELNLIYMKGDLAHAGFPEVAYSRYAATLVEKGYKVARIEQTETPAMMEERVKNMRKPTKFDKVVEREVCQVSSKGTRVNNFMDYDNFEGEPSYLLSIFEKPGPIFGVAFIDTTIGCFNLGQFEDDKNLSRLRTLAAHYPPSEVLYGRGNLSPSTFSFLNASLPGVRKEALRLGTEFWDASKTLKVLAEGEYFKVDDEFSWPSTITKFLDQTDSLGLTANNEGEMTISALGAVVWYLSNGYLDQQLLSQKKFEEYKPMDMGCKMVATSPSGPQGKYMVLDGITVRNLELLVNNTSGGTDGTLLARIDSCCTAMGKRTLRHWVVSPLLQKSGILSRQEAVKDLIAFDNMQEVKIILKKLPDLERLLSKIHAEGDSSKSKNHPDSRAIFFENDKYSKRKILDLLSCLDGFKKCESLLQSFRGQQFDSKMLKNITTLENEGGEFPDLRELLNYFDNAFDQESARKEGKIIPSAGVDEDLDEADKNLNIISDELKDYLKDQKKHFGCDVKYWGTGKNRFQIEIPASKVKLANDDYELASGTKTLKRYVTSYTKELLERQMSAEDQREKALMDIQRKMFYQFSRHADIWRKAIGCLSLIDCLISLAVYSASLDLSCVPSLLTDYEQPTIDIKEGKHPCLDLEGAYIPNDTRIGGDSNLIILTGPNMGGKSTLMRQTGLLVILAQIGCMVPAEAMSVTPVDRVFTRLGAEDNIVGGESTFFVELQETGAILSHASPYSLVLIDELGRGTATYDGTAIAGAVVSWLVDRRARTLFATHYHSLATEARDGVQAAHMACMVENEGHEDISQENITFLYKLTEGAAPKSHGFNAAKLAGLPVEIIRTGFAKAKLFEMNEKKKDMFRDAFNIKEESSEIKNLISKIALL